jgi:hypothetical protein
MSEDELRQEIEWAVRRWRGEGRERCSTPVSQTGEEPLFGEQTIDIR